MKDGKDKLRGLDGALIAGAAADAVDRYGTALKQHIVAYSGIDNEAGIVLKRSLKGISQYKVNPQYVESNLKQQAGFAAEVQEVARRRAKEALEGKTPTTMRTDDIPGHVNDQLFDITAKVDANGNPVPGSSAQMKFEGATPEKAVSKLLDGNHEKYIDNNCKMIVPKDYYQQMKAELSERAKGFQKQIDALTGKPGKEEALANAKRQLEKCEKLQENLESSNVTNAEALEARLKPGWSTTKEVVGLAHRAGVDQMKVGAAIGGGVSLARNLTQVFKGEKTVWEATQSVAGDTAGAAAVSYGTAFVGATIKGAAQNAAKESVRALAKTNLPAYVASSLFEIGKVMTSYFRGKIDGAQCVEQLGVTGYTMTTAAMYGAIGQVVIPIPVVGMMAGSMFGYFVGTSSYQILKDSLKAAKLAREERLLIERECGEAIALLKECRAELQECIDAYLESEGEFFETVFGSIKECLEIGDVDGYIRGTNAIVRHLGKTPLYENRDEFDKMMLAKKEIQI